METIDGFDKVFQDAIVSRAAKLVRSGMDMGTAIPEAMKQELAFETEMAEGRSDRAIKFFRHIVVSSWLEINSRYALTRL